MKAVEIDPKDPEAIRRAVEALLRDPEGRRAMGMRARECFRTKFCQERQEEALRQSHPLFSSKDDRHG